jgi:uncharacterized cupredoxin-like copper-binding protein
MSLTRSSLAKRESRGSITRFVQVVRVVAPMSHRHNNSVMLNPGEIAVLTWKFGKGGNVEYACNVPGHYQSGMVGRFEFGETG